MAVQSVRANKLSLASMTYLLPSLMLPPNGIPLGTVSYSHRTLPLAGLRQSGGNAHKVMNGKPQCTLEPEEHEDVPSALVAMLYQGKPD